MRTKTFGVMLQSFGILGRKLLVYGAFLFFLNCGAKQTVYCANDGANDCNSETSPAALEADTIPPTFEGQIFFSDIGATSATVTWSRASDLATAQTELEYKAVYALEGISLGAAASLIAVPQVGAVVAKDWTKDLTAIPVTDLTPETSYQVAVIVRDSGANMTVLGPKIFATAQGAAPTTGAGITFAVIKSSTLTLSWGGATDLFTTNPALLEYKLVKAPDVASLDTVVEADAIPAQDVVLNWSAGILTQAVGSLVPSTTYNFAVLVRNGFGKKSLYVPASVTMPVNDVIRVTTDLLPTDITASTMRIYWDEATGGPESGQLQYKIVKSNAASSIDTIEKIQSITGSDLVQDWATVDIRGEKLVSNLLPDTTYFFAILVKDILGNIAIYSPMSQVTLAVDVIPTTTPTATATTAPTATATTAPTATATTAPTTTATTAPTATAITAPTATATTAPTATATATTAPTASVTALPTATLTATATPVLQAVPPEVTGVTVTVNSDTAMSLSWASGGGSTTGYKVSYQTGATAPASCLLGTQVPAGQLSGTSASMIGLASSTLYRIRVCSVNGNPTPDISGGKSASGTTLQSLPPDVSNLAATVNSDTSISLSWISGGGSTTGYKVSYQTGATAPASCTLGTLVSSGQINGTSATIAGLTPITLYRFRVCPVNGNLTPDVAAGKVTSATTTTPPPLAAPTGVYLSWPYAKSMKLHFDSVTDAASYKAYYKTSAGVTNSDTAVGSVSSGQIITGLNSLGSYYVRIAAVDAYSQESSLSSEVLLVMPEFVSIPQNLASYTAIGSNSVNGVYVSGANIYAAGDGGLSISTDAGVTWITKTTSNGIGKNNVSRVYASGASIYAATNYGVSISTDSGNTWVNRISNYNVQDLAIFDSSIYLATSSGITISSDNGATWLHRNMSNGLPENNIRGIYASAGLIYAATNNGVAISSNNGSSWTNSNAGKNFNKVYLSGGLIYAASADYGLYISNDGGTTWVNKNNGNSGLVNDNIYDIYVSGSNIYAGTYLGLSVSTNGGTSFVTKNSGLGYARVFGVYVSGGTVYAANYGGLSISTNGGTSFVNQARPTTVPGAAVYSMYVTPEGNLYIQSSGGGIMKSMDKGLTWSALGGGGDNGKSLYVSGSNIYSGTGLGVSISTNDGTSWFSKVEADGLGQGYVQGIWGSGSTVYAATQSGFSKSINGGSTFTNSASGLGNQNIKGMYVPGNGNIYAANVGGLAISTNGGSSFTNYTTGLGALWVETVYVPSNGTIYAGTTGGLSTSSNGGTSFTNKTSTDGLGSSYVYGIAIAVDGTIYAATSGGLSISTNNGVSFINKTTANGLPTNDMRGVFLLGNTIYVNSVSSGLSVSGL